MAYVFKFDSMPNVGFLWEGLAGFASATSKADTSVTGMILLAFTFYTAIMWVASLRISGMMAFTFTTLLLGFIGLDLIFLAGSKLLITAVAVDLIVCAFSAWYMMAHVIFLQVFGKDILPVGKPWITPQPALKTVALGVSAASES